MVLYWIFKIIVNNWKLKENLVNEEAVSISFSVIQKLI